jgi:pimeloyl-ACP methyl ester carboxylesterase
VTAQRPLLAVWFAILTLAACREPIEPARMPAASFTKGDPVQDDESVNVFTIDHWVPHVSTVPANAGELVHLFVRERVRSDIGDRPRKPVLMIHGFSVPVLPGMALEYRDYDWALWLARSGGLDVFMLDFQGSGRSPRPKMDDPCNVPLSQQALVPKDPTCRPSYPFQLVTAQSDWDELDAVVEYIRRLRGVDKVALVGWSHGAVRIGTYAAQHPDKVESLLFYAPFYNPAAPAGRPGTGDAGFGPPIDPRTGVPFSLPQPGTPMTLQTRDTLMRARWNPEIKCDGQVEDGIQDVVWSAIMDNDPIGRTWGPPEGVMRVRTFFLWGWNHVTAAKISVPVLIIGGELDTSVPATLPRLYDDLTGVPNAHKLLFKVECAGHQMVWERQRKVLHHISKQWLKHGAVDGYTTGKFFVDTEGVIHPQ